jgi:hypothetical protein
MFEPKSRMTMSCFCVLPEDIGTMLAPMRLAP